VNCRAAKIGVAYLRSLALNHPLKGAPCFLARFSFVRQLGCAAFRFSLVDYLEMCRFLSNTLPPGHPDGPLANRLLKPPTAV
jgi:hypothetical protein